MNFTLPSTNFDMWDYLSSADKKIVMYGMGNGADKILDVCAKYGIEICDFFASDGFVRGHSFHGKRVLSYSEAKERYGADNMIVLLSFASCLPDVTENIRRIASECELYAPDVPVCGDELFTLGFARRHKNELKAAYDLLADEESRRIFENTVAYKLSGRIDFLFDAESDKDAVYTDLLDAVNIHSYADLGAYNGDTVRELMRYSPALSRVTAFEPDRRSFRKLSEFCDTLGDAPNIQKVNAAAWNTDTTLTFGDEGNRNSGLFAKGKTVEVTATSLDHVLGGKTVDYIKYDVEGCEKEAIEGSAQTILSCSPKLLISVYHRSEDIFALPLQINALDKDYKLYLRRYPYIPAWDLNLICTK
ncbi:MAG: FkbM family methyltransferase [Clostridia bacterium]|nr:FkbM family methyltransferase [Clostridia bacterium]